MLRMANQTKGNVLRLYLKDEELQALSSHIALTLRLHGMTVDPEFGMAPSTLRFLASKSKASEEAA